MYLIGENIHIVSEKVKVALEERDASFFQNLTAAQVEAFLANPERLTGNFVP